MWQVPPMVSFRSMRKSSWSRCKVALHNPRGGTKNSFKNWSWGQIFHVMGTNFSWNFGHRDQFSIDSLGSLIFLATPLHRMADMLYTYTFLLLWRVNCFPSIRLCVGFGIWLDNPMISVIIFSTSVSWLSSVNLALRFSIFSKTHWLTAWLIKKMVKILL